MKRLQTPALLLISALIASCTSTLQLQVLQPAELFLPEEIQTIATIDRSRPSKGFNNVVEGLITGENIGQDRRGRMRALEGLALTLSRTPRFNIKTTGIEMEGSPSGNSFEPPLPREEVNRICDQYDADALIAMELYDSDNMVSTDRREEKKKDKDGNKYTERYYVASLHTQVQIGWRLYRRGEGHILDQFTGTEDAGSDAQGDTEDAARNNLPAREAITQDVSFAAGELYGMRIAPVWVSVNREWYTTGKGSAKSEMERAARYAKSGDWEAASDIWVSLVNTAIDEKNRGRAAYNMAVANEREGQLRGALQWARRAYNDFGNKKARSYIELIRQRIYEQERVEEQMGNGRG
ncbi:MAG: hypothetical protein KDD06_16975 [Phaeodactylibacter sp.]|nr:hypothetical protein [Phaeodactylibacter sp.]MCB9291382.1 hypothetical protein [Lewinellaceae bacterium]